MQRDLTDAYLRSLKPPLDGRLEVHDSRVPGLALRLTPSGIATWSVRARTHEGKRTRPSIGRWPAVGIKEARARARMALGQIQGGGDPVQEKRTAQAEREARLAEPTVADRLEQWQQARRAE